MFNLNRYITNSWTFCHGLDFGDVQVKGDIAFKQNFLDTNDETIGNGYCENWIRHHDSPLPQCQQDPESNSLDCTNVDDVESLGCHLSTGM